LLEKTVWVALNMSKRKNVKRGGGNQVSAILRADRIMNPRPMPFVSNTHLTKRFRFLCSISNSPYSISPCKLGALEAICTVVSTQVTQIFSQVRVRSIEMWCGESSLGGTATVQLTYNGTALGILGPGISMSDTSTGSTRVAHIKYVPPKSSQASQWQDCGTTGAGTNQLFLFSFTGGSCTFDIVLDLVTTEIARSAQNTVALSGATAALTGYYYLALDNNAGATLSVSSSCPPADTNLPTTK